MQSSFSVLWGKGTLRAHNQMGLSDNEIETDMLSYLPSKRDEEPYHKCEKGRSRMNSALGVTEGQ